MSVIDFTPVFNLLNRVARLSEDDAWTFALNEEFTQQEIIRLNQEQLYEEGIDSEGFELDNTDNFYTLPGVYSQFTVQLKKEKGQRYDHITLQDTGAFYASFHVIVDRDAFTLDANDLKDGTHLFHVYGEDVMGLTEFNKERVKNVILDLYLVYARAILLQ
jgi:hypothetical protein